MSPEIEAALTAIGNAYAAMAKQQRLDAFGRLNCLAQRNAIVFVGDSNTEGFPIQEMYRGPIPFYNRGIAGDTTWDVLNRMPESVYDLTPGKVFLLIGTNDLAGEDETLAGIAGRIEEICTSIRVTLPQTMLFLLSIYPVNTSHHPKIQQRVVANRTNADIQALNALIERMANGIGIRYLDLFHLLTDAEGELNVEYTTDGLHLNIAGYEVVLSKLEEHLR
jgi:lysophospholipase L1-like esterase